MAGCWIMCTNLYGNNDDFPKRGCLIFTSLKDYEKGNENGSTHRDDKSLRR